MGSATPVRKRKSRESLEVIPLPPAISQHEGSPQAPRGWRRGLSSLQFVAVALTLAFASTFAVYALWLLTNYQLSASHVTSSVFLTQLRAAWGLLVVCAVSIVVLMSAGRLYRAGQTTKGLNNLLWLGVAVVGSTLLVAAVTYNNGMRPAWQVILVAGVLNTVVLSKWYHHPHNRRLPHRQGTTVCRNTLIVGADESGRVLAEYLDTNPHLGYLVKGFVDPDSDTDPRLLGKLTDLPTIVQQHVIDHVFVSSAWEKKQLSTILEQAHKQRFAVKLFSRNLVEARSSADSAELGNFADSILRDRSDSNVQAVLKRAMDLILGSLLLIVVLPVMIVVAILIKADSRGPVLYQSWRVGKNGRHFLCYKFRTMVSNAHELKEKLLHLNERHRPLFKIAKDPRVTSIGRFLRKYSIDELPQLWNVLRGDMALVGPRPALSEELCEYKSDHLRRFAVSPGLTGLWQVSARSDPSFLTYMNLDLYYVDHLSLWLDMMIVLRTIPAVLRAEGR